MICRIYNNHGKIDNPSHLSVCAVVSYLKICDKSFG